VRVPAADIDIEALAASLQRFLPGVDRDGVRLTFVPVGEDSYVYSGGGLFVRLQRDRPGLRLSDAMSAIRELPLDFVLKPLAVFPFGAYIAAAFPFVSGRILGPGELLEAGRCLARLHATVVGDIPIERFEHPFVPALERVAESGLLTGTQIGRVRATAAKLEILGESLRDLPLDFVVTHGDPNTHNWLVEDGGRLWLCDWGDIALGPRERDLFAFDEPHLRAAWEGYGRLPEERVLAFYRLRWRLQEIADYGTRLLDPDCPSMERDHARSELARYVR
jgi:hypothetical protein